jgi:hypothetical protein
MKQRLIWILWPSFIVAAVAEAVFFTVFDPSDLAVFGGAHGLSRIAVYSLGFFLFWLFAAASSALTCYLQQGSDSGKRQT